MGNLLQGLAMALGGGLKGYANWKMYDDENKRQDAEQKRRDAMFAEEAAHRRALAEANRLRARADMAAEGIFEGQRPTGKVEMGGFGDALQGHFIPKISIDNAQRYQDVGPGLYQDVTQSRTGRERAGRQDRLREKQLDAFNRAQERQQDRAFQPQRNIDRYSPEGIAAEKELIKYRAGFDRSGSGGTGGGGVPKSTEGERKAAGWSLRIAAGDNYFTKNDYTPSWATEQLSKAPFGIGSATRKPVKRQYDQALLEFAQGVLRKDTGATVKPEEMDWVIQTYIPTVNDDPVTKAQKAEARKRSREEMRIAAGRLGGVTEPDDLEVAYQNRVRE